MSTDQERAGVGAVDLAAQVVDTAVSKLAQSSRDAGKLSVPKLDEQQVVAYDLAHAAAAVEAARVMCRYAEHGEVESMLARAYLAEAVTDIVARLIGREDLWGVDPSVLSPAHEFVAAHRAPAFLESLADPCA